jgi:PAS domain S-box-containing protein
MSAPLPNALLQSEEHFRLIVAGVKDYAIFLLDPDGTVASWNTGAAQIKGYTASEIVGEHFSRFYQDEDVRAGKPQLELEIARTTGRYQEEGWRVRKDGSLFWASVLINAVHDERGALTGFLKITRDLTERKQAENALRTSEQRFRLLVEAVQDYAIFMLDPTGHVASWNSGAERINGYRRSEIVGRHFSVFYPPDPAAAGYPEEEIRSAREDGRYEGEGWRVRKDGTLFWAAVILTPIHDGSGELLGFAKVTRDLTKQRQAEEQRLALLREQAARAELDAANVLKDQFLAMLSHELRTPLNAILGWTQLLRADPQILEDALDRIERNTKMQAHLVDDILDVSRIRQGLLKLDANPIQMAPAVEGALDAIRPAAVSKQIEIHAAIDPKAGVVLGDGDRIRQVAWNLLSNAVKFTPQGGSIRLRLARHDNSVRLEVEDTGIGIPRDFLPQIFERFTQADSSNTRRQAGLGLGLALARYIVELHGGTITAESEGAGRGALLRAELPRMDAPDASAADRTPVPARRAALPAAGLHILLVEDDTDSRDGLAHYFEAAGARVRTTANAPDALALIAAEVPDVLVSDIGLPDVDGYALLRELRALPPEKGGRVPAVALSGYAGSDDRRKALDAGFSRHLTKPLAPDATLKAVLESVAETRQ